MAPSAVDVPAPSPPTSPFKVAPLAVGGLWSICLLTPFLARSGRVSFEILLGALVTSGLVSLGMTLYAAHRRWLRKQAVDSSYLAAAVLAGLLLSVGAWSLLRYPWLRDVAAAEEVPPFRLLSPVEPAGAAPYGEREQRLINRHYPQLKVQRFSQDSSKILGHAQVALGYLPGWRVGKLDHRTRTIEGTTRTSLGFESQVVVRVRPEGRGSVLEVRSRSDIPTGDFGENARVIQRFFKLLGQSWMCRPPADFAKKQR